MSYQGDYAEDATLRIKFTTNDSLGGAVAPSSAFEAADLTIFKDGSDVEKTSTNGITMTSPFNSIVGLHHVDIDTSNDTGDAGFWVAGADYTVILNPDETVDGQTVVAEIGSFSIENRKGISATVWDELLTGATHNIATSSGRRLRTLQDFGVYENGSVWIDTVNGVAGTVDFENGTVSNPVDNIANARTIADSVGLTRFEVVGGSSFALGQDFNAFNFFGDAWTLDLDGRSISGTYIHGAVLSGICTGATAPVLEHCRIGTATLPPSMIRTCGIMGATVTLGSAGNYFLDRCHSMVAGVAAPVFDFQDAAENKSLNVRNYSGGLEFANFGQAGSTDTASVEGNGQLILASTCEAGVIAMRGNIALTDNVAGGFVAGAGGTLSDDPRVTRSELTDDVWDEVLTGATHNVTNSSGRRVRELDDLVGYEGGAVWLDTVNGTSGQVVGDNGTVDNPSDSITDTIAIAVAKGLVRIRVASGSTVTLVAALEGYEIFNSNWTLDLSDESISGSHIIGATISGTATGANEPSFSLCHFNNATLPPCHLTRCGFAGTITLGSAGMFHFEMCHSMVAGISAPIFDFGSGLNASNVSLRHYSGGVDIRNMGAGSGSYNMSLEGHGQLIVNANNSATSTIAIRGHFTVTGDSTAIAAITFSEDARYDVAQINAQVDTALATTTYAEPGQGTPAATLSLKDKIGYLFKNWRNKKTQSTTEFDLFNDDGATVDQKATVSDVANVATKGEIETGP